ncbi:N-ethylammeline chlorohydrolase [Sulfolobus acidocaldarius SUSAZ]|nr:N-ethylammeline chlorohydrolase [Sulfolobus acidocaldarius SUSAZ]
MNVGAAFLGSEFDYVEKVNVEISDGIISHIGHGYDTNAKDFRNFILFPPLVNSHTHTADYSFPEYGIRQSIKEVVGDPLSQKYTYFKSIDPSIIRNGIENFIIDSQKFGVLAIVDFREQGINGAKLVSELRRRNDIKYIILGRLDFFDTYELNELSKITDGYGLPSISSNSKQELLEIFNAFSTKIRAVHISETLKQYLLDDFRYITESYKPNLLIHATHFKYPDFRELGTSVVFCPRSNMWFGVGVPRIVDAINANINILFGTDNAGLLSPNLWLDLELGLLITRIQEPMSDYSKEILRGATYNAYKQFNLNWGIEEGKEAKFVLISGNTIFNAVNKHIAIIKRASGNLIYDNLGAIQNIS